MATSWARVPPAAQRRAAPQTLKEPRFKVQKKFAGAVVGRVDIPARGESSTFFNVTRSQISEHYITRTGIPLNVPVHPPPVFALEQFHAANAVAGLTSDEPVLMVPDEHELQGQIYGVGEPLPSQL